MFIVLPALIPASKAKAQANAQIVADWVKGNPVVVRGRRVMLAGECCSMCGTAPPSGTLYEIVQTDTEGTAAEIGVRIGSDICRNTHLLPKLFALVAATRHVGDPALLARLESTAQEVGAVERLCGHLPDRQVVLEEGRSRAFRALLLPLVNGPEHDGNHEFPARPTVLRRRRD